VSLFRRAALITLLACFVLTGCGAAKTVSSGPTGSGRGGELTAPSSVVPGKPVRFVVTGMRSGANVEVVLVPADKSTCCSIRVASSFRVSADGSAILRFVMPVYYRRCSPSQACTRIAWRSHEKVIVTASGYLQQARATTLIASPGY
jgi:hypothetical protein